MYRISNFILTATGSFLIWTARGFRGRFNEQMVGHAESMKWKGVIRSLMGLLFWVFVFIIVGKMTMKRTTTNAYKLNNEQVKELQEELKKLK